MTNYMAKIEVKRLNLWYGGFQALKGVNGSFAEKKITAIIGPSGCGKSTLLRVFTRMHDLVAGATATGRVVLDELALSRHDTDLLKLRKKVGMVFQRPNPFPLSIFENIVFGLKIHHLYKKNRTILREIAKDSLQSV